jgi:hypothetical protein
VSPHDIKERSARAIVHVEERSVARGEAVEQGEDVGVVDGEGLPELNLLLDLSERRAMEVVFRVDVELMGG